MSGPGSKGLPIGPELLFVAPPMPPTTPAVPGRLSRVGRAVVTAPVTGWSSVLAMALMLLVAGLAMDAPRLAGVTPGTGASQTAFLPLTIMLGGLMGLILARLPVPAVRRADVRAGRAGPAVECE